MNSILSKLIMRTKTYRELEAKKVKEQAEIIAAMEDAIKNWQWTLHCPVAGEYRLHASPDKNGNVGISIRAARIR